MKDVARRAQGTIGLEVMAATFRSAAGEKDELRTHVESEIDHTPRASQGERLSSFDVAQRDADPILNAHAGIDESIGRSVSDERILGSNDIDRVERVALDVLQRIFGVDHEILDTDVRDDVRAIGLEHERLSESAVEMIENGGVQRDSIPAFGDNAAVVRNGPHIDGPRRVAAG